LGSYSDSVTFPDKLFFHDDELLAPRPTPTSLKIVIVYVTSVMTNMTLTMTSFHVYKIYKGFKFHWCFLVLHYYNLA